MQTKNCFHCGNSCSENEIISNQKSFCCNGCKTVYELLSENDLGCYYDFQNTPGAIPKEIEGKYDYLDQENIKEKLLEFNDEENQVVSLSIPHIHCSSCIWILENLNKLNPAITASTVNFGKKTIRIQFNALKTSLKEVVILLNSIGYEPYISLENYGAAKENINRQLIYKLGVAGFAFGNVMFLSFPEYFEKQEFWLDQYKHLFRWMMFAFALPVVFYAAQDYFISAYKGLRSKILNIDVPIALGIIVLFLRSTFDIFYNHGSGFFDSLTGLVFFLLIGKFFQQKTYSYLSFERDYKSYFPIAVTLLDKNLNEKPVSIYDVKEGDRVRIRNQELIPMDGILISGKGMLDYSFVTGEEKHVKKQSGDKVFAGGKQQGESIEIEVLKTVNQSYLTQLWSNAIFDKNKESQFTGITNQISKNFTVFVLGVSVLASVFWFLVDSSKVLNVFTSVLIIACPCALALASPFTFGNLLRIFGKKKFYLKNIAALEQLATVNSVLFDKTGTLTTRTVGNINSKNITLNATEKTLLKTALSASNHPLSRALFGFLEDEDTEKLSTFEEVVGKGIIAKIGNDKIWVGSADLVGAEKQVAQNTTVYVKINETVKGYFIFNNSYRKGIESLFFALAKKYKLGILSGDNEGELSYLITKLPKKTSFAFNQKPENKLEYVKARQQKGETVAMVGDGLNDAGALQQSEVGIVIAEDINVFSPACDAILASEKINELPHYLLAAKKGVNVVKWSILISFCYNIIGLSFAVSGNLEPVIAAILMPISSVSVVVFTTIYTNIIGRKLN